MTLYHIAMYEVGGAIRDDLLGLKSKDRDFVCVVEGASDIDTAWDALKDHLVGGGYTIFLETKQYLTLRAKFPKEHVNYPQTCDFVLAREEGPYVDGRRPAWVRPGSLETDLKRRDYTVNSLCRAEDGTLIDLFDGYKDLMNRDLRAVGDPLERLNEDALRAFRAIRFAITKGFMIDGDLSYAMKTVSVLKALEDNIAADRIRDELTKCFAHDTVRTVSVLAHEFPELLGVMDRKGIWLRPTLEKAK